MIVMHVVTLWFGDHVIARRYSLRLKQLFMKLQKIFTVIEHEGESLPNKSNSKRMKHIFLGESINVISQYLNYCIDIGDIIHISNERFCASVTAYIAHKSFIDKDAVKYNICINDDIDILFQQTQTISVEKIILQEL